MIGNTLIDEKGLANETYINIIRRAHREGHIVANHTYTHASAYAPWLKIENKAEAFRDELVQADNTLTKILGPNSRRYFRPPGGWWLKDETNLVLDDPIFADYLGPVGWNIGGGQLGDKSVADHECWSLSISVEVCGKKYVEEIEKLGKGIVLFHDDDSKTADMFINHIYPEIKKKGYKIISLDEVPYYKDQIHSQGSTAKPDD